MLIFRNSYNKNDLAVLNHRKMLRKVGVLTKELQNTYSLQTGSDSCTKLDQKLMKVGLFFL